MKPLAANIALLIILTAVSGRAQEIGYWEDFALAQDRTVPLAQLIPGTEDYYYFHCLHYQNTHQFDKVEPLLKLWVERHKETPRVHEIPQPAGPVDVCSGPSGIARVHSATLGLEFNHQRETIDRKPELPTSLDPHLIDRDRLYKQVLPQHENLQGFEDSALGWLIGRDLDPDRLRDLLSRLARPDQEGLARLVVEDLQHANSGGFGSLGIHGQLLLPQLDECLKLKPDLLHQDQFVSTYLAKLQPSAGVDWRTMRSSTRRIYGVCGTSCSDWPPAQFPQGARAVSLAGLGPLAGRLRQRAIHDLYPTAQAGRLHQPRVPASARKAVATWPICSRTSAA